ncbi:MAG TPA: phenylacetate--CoA ligase [Thermogutta sp.]|nr:phenylacetate--CoA ligase [Thermogutta sp.]HOP76829.1 phenylacetate--CoA ligase [Thermogutta sp.]
MSSNLESWSDGDSPVHPLSAVDFLPRPQLQAMQLYRLQGIVRWTYERVPLFRQRMDERGLKPKDIRELQDIEKLPFSQKADLHACYPTGLFACSMQEIVRLHASSGTKSKPTVVAYTQKDLDLWASVMARTFLLCGIRRGDIIQNAYGYGLFTGGLGFHSGAEALGATVIPISTGNSDRQIMIMKDFGCTAICCTPSYFLHLIERARDLGVDLKKHPVRVGIFGAEPWTEAMRQRIQEEAGIKAHDCYGLSEIIGPGVAAECPVQQGLHIFEDHFYPEIVDPNTGEVLPEGEEGELVLTTLTKQAMPMIRYRTRDITRLISAPCPCGRTIRRIARIRRRSDDMLIIRGVNVFPSQIEEALLTVEGTLPHYQIVLTREDNLDQMEVRVEVTPGVFTDTVGAMEQLRQRLIHQIETTVGIRVRVRLVEPQSLQRSEGKAKRVLDLREQQ